MAACSCLFAQQRKGTISYERKIDVYRHMQDDQMKAMVPQFQTAQYQLTYLDSVCVYGSAPEDQAPDPFDNPTAGGTHIVMHFTGPGDGGVLYRNFSSGRLLEQTTLADIQYVIEDSIGRLPWKLSADTLAVLGHRCKKATAISPRNKSIVAWYCEDIAEPLGPERYGGLPGAILKLDVDSGGMVYTATHLGDTPDKKSLRLPAGKRISRADFAKKLDEVLGPADSQGRRIIRN